jgi:hypothetical protein
MKAEGKDKAYLLFSRPENLQHQAVDPNLEFRRLKSFPSAIKSDEVFTIYHVQAKHPRLGQKIYLAIALRIPYL